jgi:hypothetical protein
VPIRNDSSKEGDETFTIKLSKATGAGLGTSTATVTIHDDDGSGSFSDIAAGATQTGRTWAYFNPAGRVPAPVRDVEAFASCP